MPLNSNKIYKNRHLYKGILSQNFGKLAFPIFMKT